MKQILAQFSQSLFLVFMFLVAIKDWCLKKWLKLSADFSSVEFPFSFYSSPKYFSASLVFSQQWNALQKTSLIIYRSLQKIFLCR
mgnify:CR=1 FL=1